MAIYHKKAKEWDPEMQFVVQIGDFEEDLLVEFEKISIPNKAMIKSKLEFYDMPHHLHVSEKKDDVYISRYTVDGMKYKEYMRSSCDFLLI